MFQIVFGHLFFLEKNACLFFLGKTIVSLFFFSRKKNGHDQRKITPN